MLVVNSIKSYLAAQKISGRQNAHRRRKKDVCMLCYFDTSHISTPLPVTSVLATVMLLPV